MQKLSDVQLVEEAIAQCGGRIAEYAAIGPVQRAEVVKVCLTFKTLLEGQRAVDPLLGDKA